MRRSKTLPEKTACLTDRLLRTAPAPLVSLQEEAVGYGRHVVLREIDLSIVAGERVVLLGRSGVGKSTLLNRLHDALAGSAALIPQTASLVPQLACFHNVYMGRLDRHGTLRNLRELVWPSSAAREEVGAVLARVGLADALWQKAGSLSGGQAQRTSVARAIYNGRPVVVGDEPVSALDRRQGAEVLDLIRAVHPTSILALHDIALALEHATRIVVLQGGRIVLDAAAVDVKEADLAPFYEPTR